MQGSTYTLISSVVSSNERAIPPLYAYRYVGESQVSEDAMATIAEEMAAKGITKEDNGAVLVDFTELLPGKEGKRLGKAVVRYVFSHFSALTQLNPLAAHTL